MGASLPDGAGLALVSAASMARHFLTGAELDRAELLALLDRAAELKAGREDGEGAEALARRSVALVFERPSTRTRVSFEVGVAELGGTPIVLRGDELQLTRGESIADTGRVMSRFCAAIAIRSGSHEAVEELAAGASVPVINGLTPRHHPCQALADLLTLRERFGELDGLRLAYVGDGNNCARSLAILGGIAGVEVVVASPRGLPARGRALRADRRPPGRGRGGGRALHGRLGQHGRRGRGRAPPHRPRPLPAQRRADGRRLRPRPRPPLPPRPPRRGDHGRRPLRPPLRRLGPGREPPARPEGAAGDAGLLRPLETAQAREPSHGSSKPAYSWMAP